MHKRFKELPETALDPIMLANAAWRDFQEEFDDPINTTVGVLLDPETGAPWQPMSVTNARVQTLENINHGNEYGYQTPAGHRVFLDRAEEFVFGMETLDSRDVFAYQSLGGTGALSLAKEVIEATVQARRDGLKSLYLDAGWPNHQAIFGNSYYSIVNVPRLNPEGEYDHSAYMERIASASKNPVLLVQACGYNDDGMDRSPEQWDEIMDLAVEKEATVIIDAAYLGLVKKPNQDRYAIDAAMERGLFTFVCMSTSKNMGLYNERLGALFIGNAYQQLGYQQSLNLDQFVKKTVRRTVSSPPLLAAGTAAKALESPEYYSELGIAKRRLNATRAELGIILAEAAPNVFTGNGLFTKLLAKGFSSEQQDFLRNEGILTLPNSRINIGGIAPAKVDRVGATLLKALQIK